MSMISGPIFDQYLNNDYVWGDFMGELGSSSEEEKAVFEAEACLFQFDQDDDEKGKKEKEEEEKGQELEEMRSTIVDLQSTIVGLQSTITELTKSVEKVSKNQVHDRRDINKVVSAVKIEQRNSEAMGNYARVTNQVLQQHESRVGLLERLVVKRRRLNEEEGGEEKKEEEYEEKKEENEE